MTPNDPKHGTSHQTWQTVPGCPCASCEAARAFNRRNYKLAQMGRGRTIPNGKVVAHIDALIAAGWTQSQIAKASGVSDATVSEARNGKAQRITARHAVAILALHHEDAPRHPSTSSVGTMRRIQALARLGYTVREVCRAAGLSERYMAELIDKDRRTCSTAAAQSVEDVYRRFCMVPPIMTPHRKRSKSIATRQGWPPPLAWINIDDPNEKPQGAYHTARKHDELDPNTVQRFFEGDHTIPTTRAEKEAIAAEWLRRGGSVSSLGRITGWRAERYTPGNAA